MERDGLQKSLRVLQEEYQTVAKEAKVHYTVHGEIIYNSFTSKSAKFKTE